MSAPTDIDLSSFQFLLYEGESLDPALLAATNGLGWLAAQAMTASPAIAVGVLVGGLTWLSVMAIARLNAARHSIPVRTDGQSVPGRAADRPGRP
ncbi:MAG: hypothetical protein AAGC57_04875 [Pseudomonadota bacterium]